jgi:hypothetical protein
VLSHHFANSSQSDFLELFELSTLFLAIRKKMWGAVSILTLEELPARPPAML